MSTERAGSLLSGWAVILGSSSGFGAACAVALAKAGMDIFGVHLDRRSTLPMVEQVQQEIKAAGREAVFFNVNAADEAARNEVLTKMGEILAAKKQQGQVNVFLHSLAFGALKPMVGSDVLSKAQVEMTLDVMAHSLVYWAQGLLQRELMVRGGRIFAMTSSGSLHCWGGYGAVSAAKAALESHIRQLAWELAPLGVTANSLRAGVTVTPASSKIPGIKEMIDVATRKNPHHRLTEPKDVGECIVALARPETYWLTGNILNIDGGEEIGS
jgi:NAD(P)-dependent dehydrogenase (short-subunit alcohol dehydrogenase family)